MTFIDILQRLFVKLTSGRFILTICVAATFAYMAVTGTLKEDNVMIIITTVMACYFSKERPKPPA